MLEMNLRPTELKAAQLVIRRDGTRTHSTGSVLWSTVTMAEELVKTNSKAFC